ncbi:MAG TPA: acetolactate synthase large subunit [Candidatus Dormibacteraeota bacterium]|nr:acetolactate synthase large subunit [Candidatus Dormibacteraeota bacterium]
MATSTSVKGSDLVVECLENEDVEFVFQVPGEETLALTDSLGRSKKIKLITVRHEQAAAFMAGVYGRLTGRPGVCSATLGPGATNLVTGIADANVDRAPLVALTGQAALEHFHKEYHQYVDVVSILRPVTKWNTRLYKADTIPEAITKAFRTAEAEKPGSCHLEIPEDIADQTSHAKPIPRIVGPEQPRPTTSQIEQAAQLLNKSKSPLILAGNGIIRAKATGPFRRFLVHARIPVAHTFMGKGALPDDDLLSLYAIGLPSEEIVNKAFELADLIMAIGYDLVEYAPSTWNPHNDKTIVHVDSTNAEIDMNYQPSVQLVGHIGETLSILTNQVRARSTNFAKSVRDSIVAEASGRSQDESHPLKPQRILHDLRQAMKLDDILVSDVGDHKLWISRLFPTYEPNTVLVSNGYASMGIGVPGAIAAKLVNPSRRVVAACGDGGFLMTAHEIETSHRLGLDIVVLIFHDNAYGSIKRKELTKFGRTAGVEFGNPDFVKLAEAFGVQGHRILKASELLPTLESSLDSRKTSIIDVPVDYS